jgi:rubredoxin
MTDDTHEVQGEAEPLNWACTNCGYRVEGELPEKCPDCGADKEMFDEVPVPGFSTLSPTGFACQPLSTLQP